MLSHQLHHPGGFSDPLKAFPSAASEDVGRQPHWCMTREAERSPAPSNQGADTTVVCPKMLCPSEVTQKPRDTATEESHPHPRRGVWSCLQGVPRTRESLETKVRSAVAEPRVETGANCKAPGILAAKMKMFTHAAHLLKSLDPALKMGECHGI